MGREGSFWGGDSDPSARLGKEPEQPVQNSGLKFGFRAHPAKTQTGPCSKVNYSRLSSKSSGGSHCKGQGFWKKKDASSRRPYAPISVHYARNRDPSCTDDTY